MLSVCRALGIPQAKLRLWTEAQWRPVDIDGVHPLFAEENLTTIQEIAA
jgi:hypothetical protein